jgi:two-component system CheB/CheR fusion protein
MDEPRSSETPDSIVNRTFPIVGVGASAGGLDAFSTLLRHLPLNTGMGFVLVQHLDPEHESALTQLLQRATALPVHEIENDQRVEPDHVYVIPPNTELGISGGVLKLRPRAASRQPHHPIDSFLEELASDQGAPAIGVILSGTATDGTLGLEAIKAEGGITFAQDASARYDSMPRSAWPRAAWIRSRAGGNREELDRIAKHPVVPPLGQPHCCANDRICTAPGDEADARPTRSVEARRTRERGGRFEKVLLLLRNHSGVDFSAYKSSTL